MGWEPVCGLAASVQARWRGCGGLIGPTVATQGIGDARGDEAGMSGAVKLESFGSDDSHFQQGRRHFEEGVQIESVHGVHGAEEVPSVAVVQVEGLCNGVGDGQVRGFRRHQKGVVVRVGSLGGP